jgi:pimeloyl-ACP methyl ester carboxylesterase
VKGSIEARQLLTVDGGSGIDLRVIYHRSHNPNCNSPSDVSGNDSMGVLFLNPGFLPSAGPGDTAVYWADSFAKIGYPSFRLDLPGLGDSDGDLPIKLLEFVHLVNSGCYAPTLSSVARNLTEQFNLSGMVIVGHCAGAVSAIYAASICKEVKGVVLLDPYFHCPQESTNVRKELRGWVKRNRLGGLISNVYDRLKYVSLLARGNRLPRTANFPLIRCWNQMASAGLPILILKAPMPRPRAGDFDYLRHLQLTSRHKQNIIVEHVEGTNHAFVKGAGREEVRNHTERWLGTNFPLTRAKERRLQLIATGR